jgi:hypothetical protein
VAVPEAVTLAGVIAPQARPDGTPSVKLTVPVKPFRYVMVIVDIVEVFTVTAPGEVAVMLKSVIVNVAEVT